MAFEKTSKMYILISYKITIKEKEVTNLLIEQVWVHIGIQWSIILDRETIFLSAFWITLWEQMDTNLIRYITFTPQIDGKIEVM